MKGLLDRFTLPPTDLFRDMVYRRLWTSILISSFGMQVTVLALPLTAAIMLHASSTQMGITVAMQSLAFVLFSLPAGVVLDRIRKLPIYVLGELTVACVLTSVPVASWMGWLSMPWIYVVSLTLGFVDTTAGNAAQLVLIQIVSRERLVEAYAKNTLATSTAQVTGPAAAGALIKLTGAPFALLGNAALALVSAGILRGLAVKEETGGSHGSFLWSLRQGLRYVRRHELLVAMAICVGAWQLCAQAAVGAQILFALRQLGLSARGVGLCYVALGVGTVAASAVVNRLSRKIGPGPVLLFGFAVSGVGWALLAVAPLNGYGILAFSGMLFLSGVGGVFVFVNFMALRQSVTPLPMLGRVNSAMRWLIFLGAAPGALFGGWLGQRYGLRIPLGFAGIASVLVALAGWRFGGIRSVSELPEPRIEEMILGAGSH